MPNREVEELMVVKINRCRIDGCRRTDGHKGEHMDTDALNEHVIASHERYITELESKLDSSLAVLRRFVEGEVCLCDRYHGTEPHHSECVIAVAKEALKL